MTQRELSRRALFYGAIGGALIASEALRSSPLLAADGKKTTLDADQALARLKQGNKDFLADKVDPPIRSHERRLEIARGQTPFAVLVGCSDSRVPPENLFGVGLGELFIVRNAGNTVDTVALGSIEYGALVLGAPLIVVLGHERCGAVEAAMSVVLQNTIYPGSIGKMIEPIIPAVLQAKAKAGMPPDQLLEASVLENVRRTVKRLRTAEPLLSEPLRTGKLKVVGARYDLHTGEVTFLAD
jgi:carbonic anhydrase